MKHDKTSPKYSVNGEFILLTRKVVSTLTTLNSSVYGKKNSLRFLFGQIRNVSPRLSHLKDIKKKFSFDQSSVSFKIAASK